MSATFVESVVGDQIERELGEAVAKRVEDNLPEKYKGKSVKDIVQMHQEAETLIGRQGAELGELRKVTDQFIKRTLDEVKAAPAQGTPAKTTPVDFFADPQAAVEKAVSEHPDVKALKQDNELARRATAQRALAERHPDARDVVLNPDFQKWVSGSPVRTRLFAQAHQGYDYEAAEELLGTYKALHPSEKAKDEAAEVTPELSRGASMPRGAVPTETPAGGDKKIYRRADIIRLRMTDPKRYMELQPEIMTAYAENRVR